MIEIKSPTQCCGCGACKSICPVNCIEMKEDSEGFKYPQVDKSICIMCRQCENVCPVLHKISASYQTEAYLSRTKSQELLMQCTSGGIFTSIAKQVVENGGIAYGAAYGENFCVRHERVTDSIGVIRLAGSKYVQSDLSDTFDTLKEDLLNDKQVVFCGTPCQVAGLNNYLGKRYNKLLLIDLICHGVPSPKLWKEYVGFIKKKYGDIINVNFRSKRLGYHVTVMEEHFSNGNARISSARTNLMLKCYFKNVADRPICYECPFKTIAHCSDLTIFDGWHAREYVPDLKDDDKGYTIILVQSEKGKSYINEQEHLYLNLIDLEQAISRDGKMTLNSVVKPKARNSFYQMLDEIGIENTVNVLFPIKYHDFIIEWIKIILKRIHILDKVKGLKKS